MSGKLFLVEKAVWIFLQKAHDILDEFLVRGRRGRVLRVPERGQQKLEQFRTQHSIYEKVREKTIQVANKGFRIHSEEGEHAVLLPLVKSSDPVTVYQTLSAGFFKE